MSINCLGYDILSQDLHTQLGFATQQTDVSINEVHALWQKANLPLQPRRLDPKVVTATNQLFKFLPPTQSNNIADIVDELVSDELFIKLCGSTPQQIDAFATLCGNVDPYIQYPLDNLSPGWQRISLDITDRWTPIDSIPHLTVLDCETFYKQGNHPIICTATDGEYLYLWLHPAYFGGSEEHLLIPTPDNALIVAHNGNFDYQRTTACWNKTNRGGFLDTMSMHIATRGVISDQEYWYKLKDKPNHTPPWVPHGSTGSLLECVKLHCGRLIDKELRNIFVEADSWDELRENFHDSVTYAIADTLHTACLFYQLWQKWITHSRFRFSLYGHIRISMSRLTVADDWFDWIANTEKIYADIQQTISQQLSHLADLTYQAWQDNVIDNTFIENDPWLSQLNWEANWKLKKDGTPLSKYYGIPDWYRERIKTGEPLVITTKSRIAHILLRITFQGDPIVFTKTKGICTRIGDKLEKVPHPEKPGDNVGGLLNQGFEREWDEGILSSSQPDYIDTSALDVVQLVRYATQIGYWTSTRQRVMDANVRDVDGVLTLQPNIIPHNTVSRRCGESLWLTTPGVNTDIPVERRKIGSEIKAKVQAPPGHKFIGFDIDSEEAVIFGMYGDVHYGVSGASPISYSLLVGDKADKTDMHSVTANMNGISRASAKTINYCVPIEGEYATDVLTPSGWMPLANVAVGDTIMGYNTDTGVQEWTKVTHMYTGNHPVVRSYVQDKFDFVSTPEHRWAVFTNKYKGGIHSYTLDTLTTEQLSGGKNLILQSALSRHTPPISLDISDDEAELIGWLYGDGCITRDRSGGENARKYVIAQESHQKPLEQLLSRLGIRYSKTANCRYYLSQPVVRSILQRAGLPHLCKTQDLNGFVLNLSSTQRHAWLRGMWWADYQICQSATANPGITEAIQLAVFLNGHISNINCIAVTGTARLKNTHYADSIAVACPTTTLDTFVIRQKNRITISKQCLQYGGGQNRVATILWLANERKRTIDSFKPQARAVVEAKRGKRERNSHWYNFGTDSHSYNFVTSLTYKEIPREPMGMFAFPRAIWPDVVDDNFTTSRNNTTIQSAGASFLSCLISLVDALCMYHNVDITFSMSYHDEVLYLMPDTTDSIMAARMLQLAHALCWCLLRYNLAIEDIPIAGLTASGISIDRVWRKSPKYDVSTPSFDASHIPPGEEYTIVDIM